jgi:hypothetical protein
MFVIAIIELILIIYKRWLFLLVPLSLLASLCYEGYFMMYFPVVFLPLIYLIVKSHDKERKKYIAIAVITFIVTFLLCFYFIYIATSNASLEQFIQHFFAVNGSDANIDNKTLTAYYLRFLTHTFNQGIFFGLEAAGFPSLLHIMSLLWLLFAILIVIFTRKIVEISRTTTDKLLFILLFIAPFLPIIAMFVTQSDWDRFLFPYVIYYIFSPIIFIIFGNETMITAYSRLADFFIRKPFFGLIISLCIIICFYDDLGWNIVRQIKNIFVYLIALISGDPTSFNPSYELVSEIPGIGDYTLPE